MRTDNEIEEETDDDAQKHPPYDNDEYEIEKIIGICYGDPNDNEKPGFYFKVKWKGYGFDYDSWEPSSALDYVTVLGTNCEESIEDIATEGYKYNMLQLPGMTIIWLQKDTTNFVRTANDGNNTKFIVRGAKGFGNLLWKVQSHKPDVKSPCTSFTYGFDGEQGFPGKVPVSVTYMIMGSNKLLVPMKAKAINNATPVNFFASHITPTDSGLIPTGKIQVFASHVTPTDSGLIPTGKISPVKAKKSPRFPTVIVNPGQTYSHLMLFMFTTKNVRKM
ncbi:hypothetical protein MKX01_033451 [Papaver californicum]|nr:hypothetical protein MKX01_033451 [Papaver californicum]